MGLFTWGSLPKAQDNQQTIDEAISSAITQHEQDPTAHLGEGESLQQHKSNEVIDHLKNSIVPDKFSNLQGFLQIPVIPPNPDLVDNADLENWSPFMGLYQTTDKTGEGTYSIANFVPSDLGYLNGDVLVDFMLSTNGSIGTLKNQFLFGFGKIEMTKTQFRVGYYTTSWQYSSWINADCTKLLRFRFEYLSDTHILNVYLKNTIVFTISYTIAMSYNEFNIYAVINRGTSSADTFLFGNIQYWLDGI
jgi:hypothetical protein